MHNFMFSKGKFVNFSESTLWGRFQCDDAFSEHFAKVLAFCVLLQPTMAFCKSPAGVQRPQVRHHFSEGSLVSATMQYFDWHWSLLFRWMNLSSALIFLKTKLFTHCSAVTTSMLKCPRKFKCLPQEDNFYQLPVTITLCGKIPLESFPEEQPCINTVTFLLEEGAFLFTVITRRFGQLIRKAGSLSGQAVCGAV